MFSSEERVSIVKASLFKDLKFSQKCIKILCLTFLNFEIILSNANLFICLTMFEKHNDSIKIMNDENIGIVENYIDI